MSTFAKRNFVVVKGVDGSERTIRSNSITIYYQYSRKKGRQSIVHGRKADSLDESYP